jgi:hypothetical protein
MSKVIKSFSGASVGQWYNWVCRVLDPPLAPGVAGNPDVLRFVKAFKELLEKVQERNSQVIESDNNIESVFMDLLQKDLNKGRSP